MAKSGAAPVAWITGLAGAGKTSVATKLVAELRAQGSAVVHLDGDRVRETFNQDLSHSLDDRIKNAYTISKLAKFISEQGISVVCSTMSLYPEIWEWNRKNIAAYLQVYLRVDPEVIKQRDQKGLYSGGEQGLSQNVVGVDLKFHEPLDSDLVLDNSKSEHLALNVGKIKQALIKLAP